MELGYTYWKDDGWFVGYLDEYPDYTTQGETIEEFEKMLFSLYKDITSSEFSFVRRHGKLRVA
jgi:hypothetical protein